MHAARGCCRLTTYRHRFARAAPAPRAKRNDSKNCGRASPVKCGCFAAKFRHLWWPHAKGPGQIQNNLTLICSLGANLIEFIKKFALTAAIDGRCAFLVSNFYENA